MYRSRASHEAEFETIISSIKALKNAPTAVKKMLPRLDTALRTLKGLPPTLPGRPPKETEMVPASVQHAALALNFAQGDLLAQAGSDATDARLASLQRLIVGRRKGDVAGPAALEPEAEKALSAETDSAG